MIDRSDLEAKRSPPEMQKIRRRFAEDRETYPDEDVHLRRGVFKVFLEEYLPLCTLASNLPGVLSARLMPQSNEGPDALVEIQSSQGIEELAVQITVANQSHQDALARELLSRGQPVFQNTEKVRDPAKKGEIQERGRMLTTRETRLRGQVAEVVAAVRKKLAKFHAGTNVLLVGSRIRLDDSAIAYSWRSDLTERIADLGSIPYGVVYLANGGDELLTLFKSAQVPPVRGNSSGSAGD